MVGDRRPRSKVGGERHWRHDRRRYPRKKRTVSENEETTMNPGSQWIVEFGVRENQARERRGREQAGQVDGTDTVVTAPRFGQRYLGGGGHLWAGDCLIVVGTWLKARFGQLPARRSPLAAALAGDRAARRIGVPGQVSTPVTVMKRSRRASIKFDGNSWRKGVPSAWLNVCPRSKESVTDAVSQ